MGKCIEIELQDDGRVTVTECAPKEEAMPGGENMEGEGAGQAFASVDEALNAVKQMLSGEPSEDEAMASIQKGYGPKRMGGNTPQQVFGQE